MIITYHIIALKYKKSRAFPYITYRSKIFLIVLHIFIVVTNIFLYFFIIVKDVHPISIVFRSLGILIFASGLFIIFWGIYVLRKAVFIPENKLIVNGPYAFVRHPMYLGGIIGALGLALYAGSLLGFMYSSILAVVLSHIATAEEEDLKARLGQEYSDYADKVPKLFPRIRQH